MAGMYDAPSLSLLKVDTFKGIDVSAPEDQIAFYRAADALNMMPDAMGEVRKRPGIVACGELGFALGEGEAVTKVAGDVVITAIENGWEQGHRLYFKGSLLMLTDTLPTVQRYGERSLVFVYNEYPGGETNVGRFAGDVLQGALFVLSNNERVCYGDNGKRYVWNGDWSGAPIAWNDPLLKTPVIMNGAEHSGGANPFQKINGLSPWVCESYCLRENEANCNFILNDPVRETTNTAVTFDEAELKENFYAEILVGVEEKDPAGGSYIHYEWKPRTVGKEDAFRPALNRFFLNPNSNKGLGTFAEGIDGNGFVTKSPKEGEDNLRIYHRSAGFQKRFIDLCACACSTVFGVGGHKDRLFLGGSRRGDPEQRARVWYSELEDPFYIADLNYIKVDDGAEVRAVDGTGSALAILTDRGIFISQGAAQDTATGLFASDAVFTVSALIHAPAPIGYGNTAVLGGEIVYLSTQGVVAVVYQQKYNERYAEHRSALIDPRLLSDGPQRLVSLGRYLLIFCADGICWLLDENQPNREGDRPYAAHQYEGFRLDGFHGAPWEEGGRLYLMSGRTKMRWTLGGGEVYFDGSEEEPRAISAFWETPYFFGSDFKRKKIFMRLGVMLEQAGFDTSVQVEGKKNDEPWKVLWGYDGRLCSFAYGRVDYRLFTFAGKAGLPIQSRKIKIKKAQRFKLRFSNNFLKQTMILREFSLDYVQED